MVDDLFEDDEDGKSGKKDDKEMAELPSKRKYLEQKWKLNPDDEKEFKGFPDQKTAVKVRSENEPVPDYPCFAVVYKFRREYMDVSIDAMLADHRGHCQKFKRLVNSEVIKMNKAKGVVLLWTGLKEDDAKETKADIMAFLEEDPLIAKDAIEKWDIIPLSTKSKDLPADVAAV